MTRFTAWWTSARVLGVTACIAGFGLSIWPGYYDNPAYRVLFSYVTARQAGLIWLALGILSIAVANRWSIALFGSALIGWGLGLGAASVTTDGHALAAAQHSGILVAHHAGSPLGWVWFVGFGAAVLRTLAVGGPERMRS